MNIAGWTKIPNDSPVDFDLDKNVLQVRQSCLECTKNGFEIELANLEITVSQEAGKVEIHTSKCLPSTEVDGISFNKDGIWTFVKTEASLTIYLDDIPLKSLVYNDSLDESCREKGSVDGQATFLYTSTTEDEYREFPKSSCTKFPFPQLMNVGSDKTLPVPSGTLIKISYSCPSESVKFGSTEITCHADSIYIFTRTPQCIPAGECTGLYPAWNYVTTSTSFPVPTGTVLQLMGYDGLKISGSTQVTCLSETLYKHTEGEPHFTPLEADGWKKPAGDEFYAIDLTKNPLQILTNTPSGTRTYIFIEFWTETDVIGAFVVRFDSHPWYQVTHCQAKELKFHYLPESPSKVWTLVLTPESFTVYCNTVEVINIVFTDKKDDFCKEKWPLKITRIRFSRHHVATSDFYRQLPVENCTGIPSYWNSIVSTSAEFPVSNGDKISLTETCQGETKYFGSTEVTCLTGTTFSFTRSPKCLTGGECTGLFPGWNFLEADTEFPVPTGTVVDLMCHEGLQISGSTQITCHNTTFYIYTGDAPLCTPEEADGWLKPLGDTHYDIDSTKGPLQIVTNTPSGTRRYIQVEFWTETGVIGSLHVRFEHQPWYQISYCQANQMKFHNLPESHNKVWTIVITPGSFTVYCNTVEVINAVFTDKEDDFCKEKWPLKIAQIRFSRHHVATSDYYRQLPVESCTGLPSYWNSIVSTSAQFPVSNGEKITLTETCQDGSRFFGSTEVTCLTKTMFSFTRSPQCLTGGECTELYPGWNFLETDTEFPVPTGTVVDVTCYDGLQISGSTQITCYDATIYLYSGEAPLCTPEEADGWLKPLGDTHYDIDLTQGPLQIVTNTPSGTRRYIQVEFWTETEVIGALHVRFEHQPWYQLSYCDWSLVVFENLPESPNKVWTIVPTQESFTVYCNNIQVINIVFTDRKDDFCKEKWPLNITRIRFSRHHVATSDFYRQQPVESCTGLPSYWSSIVTTSAQFPVSNGEVISLTETCQGETKYFGSTEVTCLTGTTFSFSKSPECLTGGECTGLFPGWSFLETDTEFPVPTGTVVDLMCHEGLQISGSTQITCHNTTFYIYTGEAPLCTPEEADGWLKPLGDTHYDIDLTQGPLQIATNTPSGTKRYIQVEFWTETEVIGALHVRFEHQPWYEISHCRSPITIKNLPESPSKVWTIVLTQESFTVYCNNIQVINIVFTDKEDDICKEKWRSKITQIRFSRHNVATSDYYRQLPVQSCTGLPDHWNSIATSSTQFPVSNGEKITLTEACLDGSRFFGSTEVTCLTGGMFSFTRSPQCLDAEDCTGLYPGWDFLKTETKFPVPFGTQVDVKCYDQLEMSGSAQVTCLSGFYFTQDEAPACSASEALDWSKPVQDVLFTVNLQESRLLILTNTPAGTNRHMHLKFYRSNQFLGDLFVKFAAAPIYHLGSCHEKEISFSNLPAETSKLWSFSTPSGSLVVKCNGIKVMEVSFEECGESWSDGLDSVLFGSHDTVSDFFKLHLETGR